MSNKHFEYSIASIRDYKNIIQDHANILKNRLVFLEGTVGVGKTEFVRQVVFYLFNNEVSITSPTFNVVSHYPSIDLYHIDLYRITEKKLPYFGIEDIIFSNSSIFIEWPQLILTSDKMNEYIAKEDIVQVQIEDGGQDVRNLKIYSNLCEVEL